MRRSTAARGERKRVWIGASVLCILLTGLPVSGVHGRTRQRTQPSGVVLDLSRSSGIPGGVSAVTLTLSAPANVREGVLRVSYPTALVSFLRAERGAILRRAQGEVTATERKSKDEDSSVVEVRFTAASGVSSGILGYLHFRLHETAAAGQQAVLDNQPERVTLMDGTQVTQISATAGEIVIISPDLPPLFSCFFYMH
jgi:hypothetical protein